ncbi:unnamed protein product [Alopecurus aequalis]
MDRRLPSCLVDLLVLVSLVASATSDQSACCRDYHVWGNQNEKSGCPVEEETNDDCNSWCTQSGCANGFCKKIGKMQYCHCKC